MALLSNRRWYWFCHMISSWSDDGSEIEPKYYRFSTCLFLVPTWISSHKMTIFGLCFILYFFKLSSGCGFWSNLQNSDSKLHKLAVNYQRCLQRQQKAELDLNYLLKCKNFQVYHKFVKWKNIKKMKTRTQNWYHRLLLNNAINATTTWGILKIYYNLIVFKFSAILSGLHQKYK